MFHVQIFKKIINDVRLHADGGILHCHMRLFALFPPLLLFNTLFCHSLTDFPMNFAA